MASICYKNSLYAYIISGEDNSAILWDLDSGLTTPQTTTLTFSTPSQEPRSSPQLENGGLMLPTLTQSVGALLIDYCIYVA